MESVFDVPIAEAILYALWVVNSIKAEKLLIARKMALDGHVKYRTVIFDRWTAFRVDTTVNYESYSLTASSTMTI
ncbi:MAG: hypothetical protein ACLP51_11550 [Syntrophobacteraceae bacterium]